MPVQAAREPAEAETARPFRSFPARDPTGQAGVELVALLPLIVLLGLVGWQAILAGQAIWLSGGAARAAARAQALGRDAAPAARAVLPTAFERGLVVDVQADGDVTVKVPIPSVVVHVRLASVTARARFADQVTG